MTKKVRGPLNQSYELETGAGASGDSGGLLRVHDSELLAQILRHVASDEANADAMRASLLDDPRADEVTLNDPRIVELVARRLSSGEYVARHGILTRAFERAVLQDQGTSSEPTPPPDEEDEEKIRDWKLECKHHAAPDSDRGMSGPRDIIDRGTTIQVVPDKGTTKDEVYVHWRDDHRGSMPSSLVVRTSGQPESEASQGGSHPGGYTSYKLDAEYLGDIDRWNFLAPSFWSDYRDKTIYSIRPGPTSIQVQVFNPRKYKFEFKFPPMAGLKDGTKYQAEGAGEIKALAKTGQVKKTYETEDATWSPSSLTIDTTKTSSDPGPDFEPNGSEMKLDAVKFFRDGESLDLDVLQLVGAILNFADTCREIVKMVKDYAPQVGWYIDWNLQLMQGSLVTEWYWKEHTDHRVFQFIDIKMALTLFSLTFELGIGVSGFSFKLQIYASLTGELAVEAGMKRDSPDGAPGFQLPTLKGKILGALGARVEAGYFFKFEAKGETAIEAELGIGINQGRGMVTFDARARWTGIKCTVSASGGYKGVGRNKGKEWQVIGESPWWGLTWPKEEPYTPPYLSESRIKSVVQGVLTDGWDIRVFDDDDDRMSHSDVAAMIADRIERDRAFDKTPKMIDGLANAIRKDLDVLGERSLRRDWVAVADLRAYLNSSVRGRSIAPHLEAGASPTAKLVAANS